MHTRLVPVRPNRRQLLRGAAVGALAIGTGAVFGALPAGTAQAYPWNGSLSQGSSGAAVSELQIRVAGWAADGPSQTYVAVDGVFGPGTAAAVRRFQSAYGLTVDGVAGPATQAVCNSLESSDGSTAHFEWAELADPTTGYAGGNTDAGTAQEYARRLMYKLEAVRVKLGNLPINISDGFRSIAYNDSVGGVPGSMHTYGAAADTWVSGVAYKTIYQIAERSGFSGLERYTIDHQHVDSRAELGGGWWWESGTV